MICRAMKTTTVIPRIVHDVILIAFVLSTSCTDVSRVANDIVGIMMCKMEGRVARNKPAQDGTTKEGRKDKRKIRLLDTETP